MPLGVTHCVVVDWTHACPTSCGNFLCELRREKFREIKKLSQTLVVVVRTGMSAQVSQIQILSKEGEKQKGL